MLYEPQFLRSGDMHWAYLVTLQLGDYSGVIAFHLEILNSKLIDFCRESFVTVELFCILVLQHNNISLFEAGFLVDCVYASVRCAK
jgi:hypothetical protein